METVNDLYEKSLALYDEISKNGTVNASKTADYKARTPFLSDILQKELWETADYTKIHEIEYDKLDDLLKVTLPTDFKSIKKIVLNDEQNDYVIYNGYKLEKDGNSNYLYVKANESCTFRVQYKPYPITITSINDNIQIDGITSLGIVYGLCRYFAMSEQNDFVERICNIKFNEIKSNKVKIPAEITEIIDVYGVGE